MNQDDPKGMRKDESAPRAQHGYRNEVSWDGGKGRQPYTNQEEELPPAAARLTRCGLVGVFGAQMMCRNISSSTTRTGTPSSQRMTGM